jgi:myo-inositol-1(or 4)-monophosphatase
MNKTDDIQLSRHLLEIATTAASRVGDYLTENFRSGVAFEEKAGYHDPVTECDRHSEQVIGEHIFRMHPDSTIVGEEGGQRGSGAIRWYVDPIDGTNNFVSQLPFFCVSIAAADDHRMLAGVIYDPVRREMMTASLDGAFLNGRRVQPTWRKFDSSATLLSGFPYEGGRATAGDFELYRKLIGHFRSVRRLGCTALELAAVALGRADIVFQTNANAWDVAAGMLLVQQAGGCYFGIPLDSQKESDLEPWMYHCFVATGANFDLEHSSVREIFGDRVPWQPQTTKELAS